jgi:hypothetical protein
MQDNKAKEHTNSEYGLDGFGPGNKSKTGEGFMNLLMYLGRNVLHDSTFRFLITL